jgi:hypothetical protein
MGVDRSAPSIKYLMEAVGLSIFLPRSISSLLGPRDHEIEDARTVPGHN